jgi:hypothetical protein
VQKKSKYKNCQYFDDWSLIEKIKKFFRRKQMSKPFLIVIDTTEATMRQSVGLGILNVHVILAEDPLSAKQTFLRTFTPFVRNQISNSIYVYDLEHMSDSLKAVPADRLPLFSFMPMSGGRPPKQSDVAMASNLGNTTVAPNVNNTSPQQQQVPSQHAPVENTVTRLPASHNPRQREFQNADANARPTTSNTLSAENADLVRRLGVTPTPNGTNEGTNLRVNASTGRNVSLNNIPAESLVSNNISQEQATLLRQFAQPNRGDIIEEQPAAEESHAALIDESLAQIDNKVLSEAELQKLNDEVKGI